MPFLSGGSTSTKKGTAIGSAEHPYTQKSTFYQGRILPLQLTILYVQEETRKIYYIYAFVLTGRDDPLRLTLALPFQATNSPNIAVQ